MGTYQEKKNDLMEIGGQILPATVPTRTFLSLSSPVNCMHPGWLDEEGN